MIDWFNIYQTKHAKYYLDPASPMWESVSLLFFINWISLSFCTDARTKQNCVGHFSLFSCVSQSKRWRKTLIRNENDNWCRISTEICCSCSSLWSCFCYLFIFFWCVCATKNTTAINKHQNGATKACKSVLICALKWSKNIRVVWKRWLALTGSSHQQELLPGCKLFTSV